MTAEGTTDAALSDAEFETPPVDGAETAEDPSDGLLLNIGGYEGPIDVLLEMARGQKVDLLNVSILELAEQYLSFVDRAKELRLELAGDYLVMAAWLAYLKSRLLLPKNEQPEDEPSPEELAEALAFQLKRLEAMQQAGAKLLERPRLHHDVYARGMADGVGHKVYAVYDTSLWDLLAAYGRIMLAETGKTMEIEAFDLYAMDDAIRRLRDMFGGSHVPSWTELMRFMPGDLKNPLKRRSALAAHFVASLEMCRDGELEIRQSNVYGPILLRSPQTKRDDAL